MIGDNDISLFFKTKDFAVKATLNGFEAEGIFFNGFEEASLYDELGVETNSPTFLCATSDVVASGLQVGSANVVVINGVNYAAKSNQPDGTGLSILELIEGN